MRHDRMRGGLYTGMLRWTFVGAVLCASNWGTNLGPTRAQAEGPCPRTECVRVFDAFGVSKSRDAFQLVIVVDRWIRPKVFALKAPPRLVLDWEPAWTEGLTRLKSWDHPILKGPIRMAWHARQRKLRIVLDLLPETDYDVQQEVYLTVGELGEGARFVLSVRRVPTSGDKVD